jgi:hypothetical protein
MGNSRSTSVSNSQNNQKNDFILKSPTKSTPKETLEYITINLPNYTTENKRNTIQQETLKWIKEYELMQLKPTSNENKQSLKELYLIASVKESYENIKDDTQKQKKESFDSGPLLAVFFIILFIIVVGYFLYNYRLKHNF